jgi:tetratricopeptide (TPR) repeat protein
LSKAKKEKIVLILIAVVFAAYIVLNLFISFEMFGFNEGSKALRTERVTEKQANLDWIATVDSVYTLSDADIEDAFDYLSQLAIENSTDTTRLKDMYYIKASIQYHHNLPEDAIETLELYNNLSKSESPKYQWLKAGCLVKQGKLEAAESLLSKTSEINLISNWLLGNFYEIQGDKTKALACYDKLLDFLNPMQAYEKSPSLYSKCTSRVEALNKENPIYLENLVLFDDRKRTLKELGGISFVVSEDF